jgi:nicotinamide mononucleotide (NMN) deamidase PncC
VADAEGFYLGGIVVTGQAAAQGLLDLPADAVIGQERLAAAMASACRQRFGADYGLSVGPFPKFDPLTSDPNSVFFGLAAPGGVSTKSMPFAAHPALVKVLCGKIALDILRLSML